MAEETHHPEDQTASVTTETNTQKIGASVKNMREMMEKKMAMMEKATGQGSGMMGGQGMMMANASANPMNDRHDD